MSRVLEIADAVLYEGYALYPYRQSSLKNRHRWMFGTLGVPGGLEPSKLRCECLLDATDADIEATARFLHPIARSEDTWTEGAKVEIASRPVALGAERDERFVVAASRETDGLGVVRERVTLHGSLRISSERLDGGVHRVVVELENESVVPSGTSRDLASMLAAHVILRTTRGAFVSLIDPPERLAALAAACRNVGAWPVLAGDDGAADVVLCSPIILADHPRVAPESGGDLFDATEMDEMLSLRILTLTPEERREAAALDPRVRDLLARVTDAGLEGLARLHGQKRAPFAPGDRVRLRPRGGADVLDVALVGRTATVASIEHDYDGGAYVAVTLDDDPGRDLGVDGKPGHRFFFRPNEVERIGGAT